MATDHDRPNTEDQVPVQVRSVRKTFGAQTVLNGISLEVKQGQTLSVLGQSGTGKSVLLKLIVGLIEPDSGSICVHGQEVTDLNRKSLDQVRKSVGFLFQQAALYDSLTVEENVAFPIRRHFKMTEEQRKKRVRDLLGKVGMERDVNKMPREISGGMQKRVGLARALAMDPDILLFDEPTAGLDPITSSEIDNLILQLQRERNMTSIVVTHDIHSAKAISNDLVLMRNGEVVIEGSFEDLKKSRDPYVRQFLGDS
jgi:phospholipid/cholesterol/gamma-HCH transport system ATP-binding protein